MKHRVKSLRDLIINVVDFFYPPFRRIMDLQTFRYAACGGGNTMLGIFIYFISYNFILQKQIVYTPVVAISPHIAAFLIEFFIIFPLGFFLMKYVVYQESSLRGRVQLARYFSQIIICLVLNYICLKVFVEYIGIYPTPAKMLTTVIVIVFSYLTLKHFTFRSPKPVLSETESN
jgi:putative flippase GtrA